MIHALTRLTTTRLNERNVIERLITMLGERRPSIDQEFLQRTEVESLLAQLNQKHSYVLGSSNPVTDLEGLRVEMDQQLLQAQRKGGKPMPAGTAFIFSGVDTSVYTVAEGKVHQLNMVQGVSVQSGQEGGVEGSIIALNSEGSIFQRGDRVDALVLQALNEYGQAAWLAVADMGIVEMRTAISIDDITCDDQFAFRAGKLYPWRQGQIVKGVKNPEGAVEKMLCNAKGDKIGSIQEWK